MKPDIEMLDRLPDDPAWGHGRVAGQAGCRCTVRLGRGDPILLLHGWPGFSYDWRRVLVPLSGIADAIAPDFRGFGASDKPDLPPAEGYTPEILADDVVALLGGLGISQAVVAGYDIGAPVAQTLALRHADRVRALALFNPAYPGIGERRFEPSVQPEFWYQHFHALTWSDRLIAHDRETVRLYLAHFYDHWCGRKEALREREFEAIVDTYARPGAVKASIAYYRARAAARQTPATAPTGGSRIRQATVVAWGGAGPRHSPRLGRPARRDVPRSRADATARDRTLRSDRGAGADHEDDPSGARVGRRAKTTGRTRALARALAAWSLSRLGSDG